MLKQSFLTAMTLFVASTANAQIIKPQQDGVHYYSHPLEVTLEGTVKVRQATNFSLPYDSLGSEEGVSWNFPRIVARWEWWIEKGQIFGSAVDQYDKKNDKNYSDEEKKQIVEIVKWLPVAVDTVVSGVHYYMSKNNAISRCYATVTPYSGYHSFQVELKGDPIVKPRNKVALISPDGVEQLFNEGVSSDRTITLGANLRAGVPYALVVGLGSGMSIATHTAGTLEGFEYNDASHPVDLNFLDRPLGYFHLTGRFGSNAPIPAESRTISISANYDNSDLRNIGVMSCSGAEIVSAKIASIGTTDRPWTDVFDSACPIVGWDSNGSPKYTGISVTVFINRLLKAGEVIKEGNTFHIPTFCPATEVVRTTCTAGQKDM